MCFIGCIPYYLLFYVFNFVCYKVRNGHIKRITDNDIQSLVLEIMGTNVRYCIVSCFQYGFDSLWHISSQLSISVLFSVYIFLISFMIFS